MKKIILIVVGKEDSPMGIKKISDSKIFFECLITMFFVSISNFVIIKHSFYSKKYKIFCLETDKRFNINIYLKTNGIFQ